MGRADNRLRDLNEQVMRQLFALYDDFQAEEQFARLERDDFAAAAARDRKERCGQIIDRWYELRNDCYGATS